MNKLLLFDIDGTLLKNSNRHKDAFTHAFKEVYNVDTTIDVIDPSGMTDQQIIIDVLCQSNLNEEFIRSKISECMKSMINYYSKFKNESLVVLPGVKNLLNELSKKNYLMGLVTGNLESIAHMKLKGVGLDNFFKLGGFGSDHTNRTELVKIAIKKAKCDLRNVFLFGDTPLDITAGKQAGVKTVGTTTGIFSRKDLLNADLVVDSFSDVEKIIEFVGS